MKVLVCGECYSPNLGDGLIAIGLEELVCKVLPDSSVQFFDMSGRSGFVAPKPLPETKVGLGLIRSMHRRMYEASYSYAAAANRVRYRFLNRFGRQGAILKSALADADYVLIGGGQLLQDNRLAFPLSILSLVREAKCLGLPVSFFSVGVGDNWSAFGKNLMSRALTAANVESIICRDQLSVNRLCSLFPEVSEKVGITYDAALAVPVEQDLQHRTGKTVGLCIMHPNTIRWTIKNHPMVSPPQATQFWVETYRALSAKGFDVKIFTNGSPEDDAFARKIGEHIRTQTTTESPIHAGSRPRTPDDLVRLIGGFGVVVAYRLHANIVATLLGIPCIALGWDAKVEEFMNYSGQSERFVHAQAKASEVVDMVDNALNIKEPKVSTINLVNRILADLRHVLLDGGAGNANAA